MTEDQIALTDAYLAGWHANPGLWKTAVLDALADTGMDTYQGQTPASIMQAVIDWHVAIAQPVQPVQRPWVGLTDDEAQELHDQWQEAIEAKLKEKNA